MQFPPALKQSTLARPDYRKYFWLTGLLVGFLAYLPSLFFYFSGEDFTFILFAAQGKPFYSTAQNLFYRPLPNLFWLADYTFWGLNPAGYHFTNLLLHLINTGLVALLVFRLTTNREIAGLASLLFALHPVHVEPVVWLAGRPDLLANLFFLVGLLTGLEYLNRRRIWFLLVALLAYALALFSKESPAALPLLLYLRAVFLTGKPPNLRQWLTKAPLLLAFLAVLLLYIIVRLGSLGGVGGYDSQGRGLLYGVWNLTIGLWLPLLFPVNFESLGMLAGALLAGLMALFYFWLGWQFWKNRTALPTGFIFALSLIYVGVLPALNIAPVQSNLSQSRLLYLPSVGFCLLLSIILHSAFSMKPAGNGQRINPRLLPVLLYLPALFLALIPWGQAGAMAQETIKALTSSALPFQPGDTIYYRGLSDDYHGAYLWRNGLNEASQLMLNPSIEGINQVEDLIVDYRKAERGRMWFLQYYRDVADHIIIGSSYAVSSFSNPDLAAAKLSKTWDLNSCPSTNDWQWQFPDGSLDCIPGQGLIFNPQGLKTSLSIKRKMSANNPGGTILELGNYVEYDFQNPQILGEIYLIPANEREIVHYNFDLAANGRALRYSLYLPPQTGPFEITLRINKVRRAIWWREIRWLDRQN